MNFDRQRQPGGDVLSPWTSCRVAGEASYRMIGSMRISNLSDLADQSDYRVKVLEAANPLTGTPARNAECMTERHDRRQSIWKLLASAATEVESADYSEL
jgi:hypothetical protein